MNDKPASTAQFALDDNTRTNAVTHWIVAVLLGVAALAVWWLFREGLTLNIDDPDFNPMVLLVAFFGAFSAVSLVKALRWTLRQRRFGTAHLEIHNRRGVGRLGERLHGVVRTQMAIQPVGDYTLVLQRVESHLFSDGGRIRQHAHHIAVWKETITVPAAGLDATRGIPFAFRLPPSVGTRAKPQPKPRNPNGIQFKFRMVVWIPGKGKTFIGHNAQPGILGWQLAITAPLAKGTFHTVFDVPVETGDSAAP